MYCPNCGQPVAQGSAFCRGCGQAITSVAEDVGAGANSHPEEPDKSPARSRTIVAVLAVTCVVASAILLYELVLAPKQSTSSRTSLAASAEEPIGTQPPASADSSEGTNAYDRVASINQSHEAGVNALRQAAAEEPKSYAALVNLANAYFDWAQELSVPQAGRSQPTTEAVAAARKVWPQARAAYEQAASLSNAFDPSVQTDRATATFYSNDPSTAIELAREVTAKKPDFAAAWLGLGTFYDSAGNTALAVESYKKYLALDPKGSAASWVNQRVSQLANSTSE